VCLFCLFCFVVLCFGFRRCLFFLDNPTPVVTGCLIVPGPLVAWFFCLLFLLLFVVVLLCVLFVVFVVCCLFVIVRCFVLLVFLLFVVCVV